MTFLHTADWQLGKPFAGIEDEAKRALVQHERIAVIARLGEVARERKAAFVVVAGDLFDSPRVTKATVSAACGAIGAIGLPVFAIPGNHDHGGPGSIWEQDFFESERAQLAPNLRVLLAMQPVEFDDAVLFPCPLLRRQATSDATTWLRNPSAWHGQFPGKVRVVIAHGSVQDFGGSLFDDDEPEAATPNFLDLSRLDPEEYDHIALGDWHGTKQAGPRAWYSGTPERDRFPKGADYRSGQVLVVNVARGQAPVVEAVPVERLGWHTIAAEFSDDESLTRLEASFAEIVGNRAGRDLVRLELTGALGIGATTRLERLLDAWEARLLRLKLDNRVSVAPTETELESLAHRAHDPLISRVADALHARLRQGGHDAAVAGIALRELHAACSGN